MTAPIQIDSRNQDVGLFQPAEAAQAPVKTNENPIQDLQSAIRNQSLSGSGAELIGMMKRHCPDIKLSELPIEVAQMILTSQHETVMEILETWSQSIQEQAELDKEANKRSMLQKESLERSQKHLAALKHALAARSSDPSPSLAPEVVPAVQSVLDNPMVTPEQDALREPSDVSGVRLRDR